MRQNLGLSMLHAEHSLKDMLRDLTTTAKQNQEESQEAYKQAFQAFNEEASQAIMVVAAEARNSVVEMGREMVSLDCDS